MVYHEYSDFCSGRGKRSRNCEVRLDFPIAFSIFLYAIVLLMPMTFASMVVYEDFVLNAYFWLLLGILFRLPNLPFSAQLANAPAPPRGSRPRAR
jgi:hypothetical protein